MSAEILRRAAAKIRETAEPVSESAWPFKIEPARVQIGEHVGVFEKAIQAAAFVNLWTPDVAETLADFLGSFNENLDGTGFEVDEGDCTCGSCEFAWKIARRILGEDA